MQQSLPALASRQSAFEAEVAALIVRAVNLETPPGDIDPTAPLFDSGLGLDSIDLLEIALAVSQRYGCELRSDDADNARIFASLRNLAAHIAERKRA
jgi:acyl carrier protein